MTTSDQSQAVLKRLIEALLDNPDALQVDLLEGDRGVEFVVVKVADEDRGKIVGRDGSHLRALAMVAQAMGNRINERWILRADLPPPPRSRLDSGRPADCERPSLHDSSADAALLTDVLTACLEAVPYVDARAEREPGDRVFVISPVTRSDASRLMEKTLFHRRETNLLSELGTAFRAIGRRQGVSYKVEAGQ